MKSMFTSALFLSLCTAVFAQQDENAYADYLNQVEISVNITMKNGSPYTLLENKIKTTLRKMLRNEYGLRIVEEGNRFHISIIGMTVNENTQIAYSVVLLQKFAYGSSSNYIQNHLYCGGLSDESTADFCNSTLTMFDEDGLEQVRRIIEGDQKGNSIDLLFPPTPE